ncbi:MAG TPA: hypothetical protein PKE21_11570 [Flavobacteriales bacterium]|nr:hypothetical protein [Flavobacteriales bacterium]HMR28109.1 hypothetical protein [Flavobacteriales bacterium]
MEPKIRTIVQAALIIVIVAAIVVARRPDSRPATDDLQATAMTR